MEAEEPLASDQDASGPIGELRATTPQDSELDTASVDSVLDAPKPLITEDECRDLNRPSWETTGLENSADLDPKSSPNPESSPNSESSPDYESSSDDGRGEVARPMDSILADWSEDIEAFELMEKDEL